MAWVGTCRRKPQPRMPKPDDSHFDLRGDLQSEVMAAVWKLGEATVDQVRAERPRRRKVAYNTVQTVLNRLVDHGLLVRTLKGRAFVYTAKLDESEYVARAIGGRLASASPDARRAALVNLVSGLDADDLDELARRANQIKRSRGGG